MAEKQIKDWITINGKHVPIYDGESKQDAVNRSIAKDNADKKDADIERNKAEADKLNGKPKKSINEVVAESNKAMQDATSAWDEARKSAKDNSEKKKALEDYYQAIHKNTDYDLSERTADKGPLLNIMNNGRVWYDNKSGTRFMLGPNKHWYKISKDGLSDDGKIDDDGFERVKKLLDALQNKHK